MDFFKRKRKVEKADLKVTATVSKKGDPTSGV